MRKTLFLILICLVFSTAIPDRVYAQVVPDGAMGTAGEISSTHKQKGGICSIGNQVCIMLFF